MDSLSIKTSKKVEVIDITDEVSKRLTPGSLCVLHVPHTTAAITINESEPLLKQDMEEFYSFLIQHKGWKHNTIDNNAEAHLLSSLIKPTLPIPMQNKSLLLGKFQRILFVELDGPRTRTVHIQVLK